MATSDVWSDREPKRSHAFAPPSLEPMSSVMASRPTAVAPMNQRTFCARVRSRRKKPRMRNIVMPIKIAMSCLGSSSGTVEPVTASDSVHRKNAMVSISKPMRRNRRMKMK